MKKIKDFIKKARTEIKFYSCIFPNVWKLLFARHKKPAIFYGWKSYEIGKKFADKRTRKYSDKDQNGKEHALFPFGELSLIVLNKIELKRLKKIQPAKSWIALKMNPRKYIKRNSYYKTEYK